MQETLAHTMVLSIILREKFDNETAPEYALESLILLKKQSIWFQVEPGSSRTTVCAVSASSEEIPEGKEIAGAVEGSMELKKQTSGLW